MKLFKRICALTVALITSILFTGCVQESLAKDGNYWFSDASANFNTPFIETCVYDVSVTSTTFNSSAEVKNPYGVKLELTSGTYTTTLETREGEGGKRYYIYTTSLEISGSYIFPGEPQQVKSFSDYYTTRTEFTENLVPIVSSRTVDNNTLLVVNNDSYGVVSYKYDYTVTYGEKDASVVINEYDDKGVSYPTRYTVKKYTNGAYVDNNTLLLIPRVYNLVGGFQKSFKTIDVLRQQNQNMIIYCPTEELDVKNFPSYELNGVKSEEQVSAGRLMVAIQDTYSGAPIEAYYATDKTTHRHRLVRVYNMLNENLGYLCYSLKSVTVQE